MNKPMLTICIPSYNRVSQVLKCVGALIDQSEGFDINLIVLDNKSNQNYLEEFNKVPAFQGALSSGLLRVIRNATNIGMSANFLRAFEVAESTWLWMLSDDDDILPGALLNIFGMIDQAQDKDGFIKFSSARSRPEKEVARLQSIESFIDFNAETEKAFNGFIFISNGIYRLEDFKPLLGTGYHYANTFIPHFMMLIEYMKHGNHCYISRKEIVNYVVPEVGYSYGMVAGLGVGAPKHAMLNLSADYYRKYLRLFFPHNDYKVIIDLFYQCKRDATPYICRRLVADYISYVSVARSFPKMIVLRLFGFVVRFPFIFNEIISFGETYSNMFKKHVAEIKIRYSK
ncbi:MAG: glycosyltransferase [Bermanella sp.]